MLVYTSIRVVAVVKLKMLKWTGHTTHTGVYDTKAQWRNCFGKQPLRRPRRRWENGIRIDIWEVGFEHWK